jgi:hypothetical protein
MKIAQVKRKSQKRGKTRNKVLTTAKWKKKLWPLFAAWVKERDSYRCFTCQKQLEPHTSNCQAGHFIPKSTCGLDLYFNELNVHCQCFHCNINLGGYGAMYTKRMVEVYGQEVVDELWRRTTNITKQLNWEELWQRYKNPSTP